MNAHCKAIPIFPLLTILAGAANWAAAQPSASESTGQHYNVPAAQATIAPDPATSALLNRGRLALPGPRRG